MESAIYPVLAIGDVISVAWPIEQDGQSIREEEQRAEVISIKQTSKLKNGSYFKYELLINESDIRSTRLLHLKWHKIEKSKKSKKRIRDLNASSDNEHPTRMNNLPAHKLILAPMVGGSELAFRLLCRKYGL